MLCKPGTGTEFPAQFAGNWLPVPGFAPPHKLRARVFPPKRLRTRSATHLLRGTSVIVVSPMSAHSKFLLADSQIPDVWVNVLPSLPEPMDPPLHPGTRAPLTPQDLLPLFPMELIEQEFSPQPLIDIPGEVMDIYRQWRATPLYRARRLEK